MNMKKWTVMAILGLLLCGCQKQEESPVITTEQESVSRDVFAMDTFMQLTAYGEQAQEAVDAAADEIIRLDELLSTGKETSEVGLLNQNGEGVLSEDTAYLLERSMDLYEDTGGLFTIAIYPVMQEWGFTSGNYKVPEGDILESLLPLTDVNKIIYNEETKEIQFAMEGMQIDFGGIAKGYTSMRMEAVFEEYGIEHAMVNLGGNVQVIGTKPDGSLWKVGIESPDKEGYLGILSIQDKAVITSGGYERYFEEDGMHYHHIIDPTDGYPADNGLLSVTIVSEDGTLADALSTSLFIMGKEKAIAYWRVHQSEFDMILLTDAEELYVSEGISEVFSTERNVEIITRE